jgi:hypothetical protein
MCPQQAEWPSRRIDNEEQANEGRVVDQQWNQAANA